MRLLFRCFAFLDLISLVFLAMQLWQIATHYKELPDDLVVKIQSIMMFPMFILILVSAIGLFLFKKYGCILYYIQFPFRLYLWIFSLGFITLLPEAFSVFDGKLFDILLKVCFVGEVIRLYLTIRGQLKFAN